MPGRKIFYFDAALARLRESKNNADPDRTPYLLTYIVKKILLMKIDSGSISCTVRNRQENSVNIPL
jgi:hypothetical protein